MFKKTFRPRLKADRLLPFALAVILLFSLRNSFFYPGSALAAGLACLCFFGFFAAGGTAALAASLIFGGWEGSALFELLALAAFLAAYGLWVFAAKKQNAAACLACCGLSRFLLLFSDPRPALTLFLPSAAFAVVLCWVLINALRAPLTRGLKTALSMDERVCLCLTLFAAASGLLPLRIGGFSPANCLALFALLFCLFCYGFEPAAFFALALGAARAVTEGNPAFLGIYFGFLVVAAVFSHTSKALSALSVVLTELVFAYLLELYPFYGPAQLAEVLAAGLAFALLPTSFLTAAKRALREQESELAAAVVRKSRMQLSNRLFKMSVVFDEMDKVFTEMGDKRPDREATLNLFYGDFCERLCADCSLRETCQSPRGKMKEAVQGALAAVMEKGRITLIDLPDHLAKKCLRLNAALAVINQYGVSYRQYLATSANLESTRAVIAKQLAGVARVMRRLGEEGRGEVLFRTNQERAVKEHLLSRKIHCSEAVVYEEGGRTVCTVLVPENEAVLPALPQGASEVFGRPMMAVERMDTKKPGFAAVCLKQAPKYDVVFGAAGLPKAGNHRSGDSHSLIHLSADKFMLALCDGMGSGTRAEQTSEAGISLVENFYRAGFDSELVLDSVNHLLSACCEEVFCTVDLCVVDLNTASADFIKLGAVPGFVKGEKTVMVNGSSLPMGILEESRPSTKKLQLCSGDIVVLVTDGVTDAYGEFSKLSKVIEDHEGNNPQELAEHILDGAVRRNRGRPRDDMTVVTLRVFEKI